MACAAAARSSLLNASRAASAAARRSDFCEGFDIATVMAGLVRACPGHPRLTFSDAKDVDTRDIGAKQSFVASPGHDDGGKMRTKNKKCEAAMAVGALDPGVPYESRWAPYDRIHGPGQGQFPEGSIRPRGYMAPDARHSFASPM